MSDPKVLVIGSSGHSHVECVSWENAAAVNLPDFDIAVINVRSLSDNIVQSEKFQAPKIRNGLARLLASGGRIIVLGLAERRIRVRDHDYVDLYDWSPVDIQTKQETGNTVKWEKVRYVKLLDHLKEWSFYYYLRRSSISSELFELCGGGKNGVNIVSDITVYQANRYEKMLAGEIAYLVQEDNGDPILQTGVFAFLPAIESLEERHMVNLVLEDLIDLPQVALQPAWADGISMEVASAITEQIDTKRKALKALQGELQTLASKKADIESHKKLLYESGRELEERFALCLRMLGGKVTPAKYSQEEFILEHAGALFLVECKGIGKSVALTHVRQLTDYMLKFEEDENKQGKGILFGNAWKELPPERRDGDETVVFPDNVEKRAIQLDIALVSSTAFFPVFERFLAGRVAADAILQRMTSSVGVVDFSDLTAGAK
ncbi:MAG: hypothetical protein EPO20_05385 [Betaproteobacteria bacterium]|nr:MAG: hypothetical protein EPO20_05385 [Betaproteobacteria bacterium]